MVLADNKVEQFRFGSLDLSAAAAATTVTTAAAEAQLLPQNCTVNELPTTQGIIDLRVDVRQFVTDAAMADATKIRSLPTGNTPILESFVRSGGVIPIIEHITSQINQWKNKDLARRWLLYLKDLMTL
jgi:hypothetical protein